MRRPPARAPGLFLALMASLAAPASAQEDAGGSPSSGLYAVPFVIYSPETSWIFGIGAAGFYRAAGDSTLKPSSYAASIQYSIKGQYVFNPSAQLYFDGERSLFETEVELTRSFESYYGVGNESPGLDEPLYEVRRIRARAEYLRRIGPLYVGPFAEYSDEALRDPRENPLLLDQSAPGQEYTQEIGAGVVLLYDARDRVYSPTEGTLARLRMVGYAEWLGSDGGFRWLEADLRHYRPLGDNQVFAFQLFFEGTGGDVPFFRLPTPGGEDLMRGIRRGRYRDRVSLVAQSEFRTDLFWRIGAAVFGSVGEVAPSVGSIALNRFRHTVGAGLRYTVDEKEKLKVRIDYGVGPGTDGFYLTVDEAF